MRYEFHAGERAVQERAGVLDLASRVAASIGESIPPAAAAFLARRLFVVIATIDAQGRPWASIVAGDPGFARAVDAKTIRVDAPIQPDDPAAENIAPGRLAGLLAIDLAVRRRMRLNGRWDRAPDGALLLRAEQVYANCPKYIQRREAHDTDAEHAGPNPVRGIGVDPIARAVAGRTTAGHTTAGRTTSLTDEQRHWIARADTFFIATTNPAEGADASHRGGSPGFVRVDGNRLVWPDYAGNSMFNTLGNIEAHPWAGVTFLDFDSGAQLQLTGRAAIDWDRGRAAAAPGAERLVELTVEEVVERVGALPFSMPLVEPSPFNPAAWTL